METETKIEDTNQTKDSIYFLLSFLTTAVVVISLSVLGIAFFLNQRQPRFVQNQQVPPGEVKETGAVPNPTQWSATSPITRTQSETWVFKGYALGKKAGNEDALGVMMADVVKLDDGRYRMYYGWAGQGGTGIKSAVSNDAKKWTAEEGFRLQGASNKNDRENVISGPSIVRLSDGRFRMYYQSSPQTAQNEPPRFHVRSAISSDGLNFTREGVRIDISPYTSGTGLTLAGHGTYFQAQDGTYVGIFSGNLGSASVPSDLVMATSKDGLTFGNFKKLYTSWHDPIVLKTKEGYKIYATYLLEKQGMAISTDGLNWPTEMTTIIFQNEEGNKLTEGNSGVGDLGGVVTADGSIKIYANWGNPSGNIVYFEKE